MRKLSVIIVGFNKARWTARCLASLLSASYRPLQLVVVNNGSKDGTAAMVESFAPAARHAGIELTTLTFPENVGSIVSRNAALLRCRGDYIALLDNDTHLRSVDVFEQLVRVLERHPEVGVVTPKLVYPSAPFRIQCAGGGITREGKSYLLGRGADRDRPEFNQTRAVPWAISACMVMPATLVREVGPLDEIYSPVGFEDIDYCFRVRVRRREIVYCPDAEIYHAENTTTFGSPTVRITSAFSRGERIFRRKWHHMFPDEPSIDDIPLAHVRVPRVPVAETGALPLIPAQGP